MGPTLEFKLTHSTPDTWHTVSHSKYAKCLRTTLVASKNVQIPTVSKFDVVAKFRETIPTVKSASSSEI